MYLCCLFYLCVVMLVTAGVFWIYFWVSLVVYWSPFVCLMLLTIRLLFLFNIGFGLVLNYLWAAGFPVVLFALMIMCYYLSLIVL